MAGQTLVTLYFVIALFLASGLLVNGYFKEFREETFCSHTQLPCGQVKCYNPKKEQCLDNGSILCNVGEALCKATSGNRECYNPSTHSCHYQADTYKICEKGEETCYVLGFSSRCYNPTTQACVKVGTWGTMICNKGEIVCGTTCYVSAPQKFCSENKLIECPQGEKACGNKCHQTNSGSCYIETANSTTQNYIHEKLW